MKKEKKLVNILEKFENLLWHLENRRGMYISNEKYEGLASYINGFSYAVGDLRGVHIHNIFVKWLRKRKNMKGSLVWDAYIYTKISNSDEKLAQGNLFKLFSEFISEQKNITDSEKIINENCVNSGFFSEESFVSTLHETLKWDDYKYELLIEAIENFLLTENKEVKIKGYIKKVLDFIISSIDYHFMPKDLFRINLVSDTMLLVEQKKLKNLLERL